MLKWFGPRCPVDVCEKVWTEQRLNWMLGQFGVERLRQVRMVPPTADSFPDPYRGTAEDVRQVLTRVCRYMAVDPDRLALEFYHEQDEPDAAGLYYRGHKGARSLIRVSSSVLGDLPRLIATLAHEVAHEILLGGGLLTGDESDHEWTTDLLVDFLGMGIFAANTAVQQYSTHYGTWESWQISRHGYLPARVHGYALALIAWARDEPRPPWARHLGSDAGGAFRRGLKYVARTGDCLFDRGGAAREAPPLSMVIADLNSPSPGRRVAALWNLSEREEPVPQVSELVLGCLRHDDPLVRCEAVETLVHLGDASPEAVEEILVGFRSGSLRLRVRCLEAAGSLRLPLSTVTFSGVTLRNELVGMLRDQELAVAVAAARALARHGAEAADAADELAPPLRRALIRQTGGVEELLGALAAIVPDPRGFLSEHFAERDPELLQSALAALPNAARLDEAGGGWIRGGPTRSTGSLHVR